MEIFELKNTKEAQEQWEYEFKQPELSHPIDQIWFGHPMHFYKGFWCLDFIFDIVTAFESQFQANDSDIILASVPKSGTTWLKSLLFTIINRKKFSDVSQHPLQYKNPHELVLHLEFQVFKTSPENNTPNLSEIPSPRVFATHMPYSSLPESIKTSKCRVVYICRNPLDNFISHWHFWFQLGRGKSFKPNMNMMEEYTGRYSKGLFPFGPYEDHLLGYFEESMQNPQKVLFLEYEGLKKEPKAHLKRIAEFLGCPFSEDEEKENGIDKIIELCSIKSLKEMEVNRNGKCFSLFENKALFRNGEIGDWTNYLTPSMAKLIDELQEKLKKSGFSFTYYQPNVQVKGPN